MALPEDDVEEIDPEPALARILDHEHDALVVGPGLRPGLATAELVRSLLAVAGEADEPMPRRSCSTPRRSARWRRWTLVGGRSPAGRPDPARRASSRGSARAAATTRADDGDLAADDDARLAAARERGDDLGPGGRPQGRPDGHRRAGRQRRDRAVREPGARDRRDGRRAGRGDRLAARPGPRAVRCRPARRLPARAGRRRRPRAARRRRPARLGPARRRSRSPASAWRRSPSARARPSGSGSRHAARRPGRTRRPPVRPRAAARRRRRPTRRRRDRADDPSRPMTPVTPRQPIERPPGRGGPAAAAAHGLARDRPRRAPRQPRRAARAWPVRACPSGRSSRPTPTATARCPVARALEAAGADGFCVAAFDEALELRDGGIRAPDPRAVSRPGGVRRRGRRAGIAVAAGDRARPRPRLIDAAGARSTGASAAASSSRSRPVSVAAGSRSTEVADRGARRRGARRAPAGRPVDPLPGRRGPGDHRRPRSPRFDGRGRVGRGGRDRAPAAPRRRERGAPHGRRAGLRRRAARAWRSTASCPTSSPTAERRRSAGDRLRPVMALIARPGPRRGPAGRLRASATARRSGRPGRAGSRRCPLGYGDGWSRALSNRASALVRGRRVPLVGNVAMDAVMADVTDVPGPPVDADDEFVLLGRQGDERITRRGPGAGSAPRTRGRS